MAEDCVTSRETMHLVAVKSKVKCSSAQGTSLALSYVVPIALALVAQSYEQLERSSCPPPADLLHLCVASVRSLLPTSTAATIE